MNTSTVSQKYSDKVYVDPFLMNLIPVFLNNKRYDLKVLSQAIERRDLEKIRKIASSWRGICSSYGFYYLNTAAEQIDVLAQNEDFETLKLLIKYISHYLQNLQVMRLSDYHSAEEHDGAFHASTM